MKKYLVVIVAVVALSVAAVGTAFAANSLQAGEMGIGVGMGDSLFSHNVNPGMTIINPAVDINFRILAQRDLAINLGFGGQSDGGDANAGYIMLKGGVRKYLKVDDFAPFMEAQVMVASVSDANSGQQTKSFIDGSVLFGAEYFLGRQFSLEGAVGVGVGQEKTNGGGKDVTDNYFGTRTVGVQANFYF